VRVPKGLYEGAMAWSYYDFDKSFQRFHEVWNWAEVQTALLVQVNDYCAGSELLWNKSEPLWQLSRGAYWSRENNVRLEKYVAAEYGPNGRRHLAEALCRAANIKTPRGAWDLLMQEKLYQESLPRPGTLESLVLIEGEEYLHDALLATASSLFPECRVFSVDVAGASYVVLPDVRLVMDLLGFYWYTREGDSSCSPHVFDELFRPLNFERPYHYRH
jgi:hypothetical protein